ncbi:hypothetical protein QVD17_38081 [Tagetes erecta]|uniref:Uncharacterized protein n=1 Tax=Tagetes erecta TaxID=13708 RepID=A0AAD8JXZ8_TARER|nr:hypothetical protein QVD17_38081 [Tagetes erecta]
MQSSSSSSSATKEPNNAFKFVSKLSTFAFNSTANRLNLDGCPSILSNFVQYDRKTIGGFRAGGRRKKQFKIMGSLSSGSRGGSSVNNKLFNELFIGELRYDQIRWIKNEVGIYRLQGCEAMRLPW